MAEIIFWISIALVFYVYAGYPLTVLILGKIFSVPRKQGEFEPKVTVLIAAYNEESVIAATVQNKLEQNYPADKIEVLIISDGSVDRTDEIVRAFNDPRVRLLRQEPRAGKTSALNQAVPQARGDIIVFSDANSIYSPEALRHLVVNFSDSQVGYVTGKMIYANPDGSLIGDGCSGYMKYENVLRAGETCISSVVGVDGGIDAVRKELYVHMNPDQLPDFVLPLKVVRQGFRVVYEPLAVLWEPSLKRSSDEYRMRVRVALRAFWALFDMRQLLSFRQNPLFAWQLWSHKVLRYLCFIFLASALISNILLLNQEAFYQLTFLIQIMGYLSALIMPLIERQGIHSKLVSFAHYFVLLNLASAHAFIKFLLGRKQVFWTPRKG